MKLRNVINSAKTNTQIKAEFERELESKTLMNLKNEQLCVIFDHDELSAPEPFTFGVI
jgi:hypothetical protein